MTADPRISKDRPMSTAGPVPSLGQDSSPYVDALRAFIDADHTRWGVPGHQGSVEAQAMLAAYLGEGVLDLDVQTMVSGVDVGPDNAMDRSLRLAAEAWGASRTWFLTNGSSGGNVTAVLAMTGLGGSLVAQRSVHSSVVDGLAMSGMVASFVTPDVDHALGIAHGVTPEALEAALSASPDARAALVVTPSYFGACADVPALAEIAHRHDAALVVDEAWGAHLGFHPELPTNAVRLGADLVVSSMHKLGGSLGQTALLHLGHGPHAERLEPLVTRALRSMQSTSESTLLLASLDLARRQIAVHGGESIGRSLAAANRLRERITADGRFRDATPRLREFPSVVDIDPLRIVIDTRAGGISGHEARHLLFREHGHHLELSTDDVIVAIIGAGVAPDADDLADMLLELPETATDSRRITTLPAAGPRRMTVREAYFARAEVVPASTAVGRVSADSVAAYPPGIPNLMPGEEITTENLRFLQEVAAAPFGHVRGALVEDMSMVRVVAN
jgi:lysine decarboxylase